MNPLYLSSRFSDYTFVCHEQRLPVHRALLDSIPYFHDLFDTSDATDTTELHVYGADLSTLEILLRYAYGDTTLRGVTASNVVDVLEQTAQFNYEAFRGALEKRVDEYLGFKGEKTSATDTMRLVRYRLARNAYVSVCHITPQLLQLCTIDEAEKLIRNSDGVERARRIVRIAAWMVLHPQATEDDCRRLIELTPKPWHEEVDDDWGPLSQYDRIPDRGNPRSEAVVASYLKSDLPVVKDYIRREKSRLEILSHESEITDFHYGKVHALRA